MEPESVLLPLFEELQGPLRKGTLSACSDQSAVGDHIGLGVVFPHFVRELQGSLWHNALSTCAYKSAVGMQYYDPAHLACTDQFGVSDQIGLEPLQPHLLRDLQGPYC